jgi:hypothetical protein
MIAVKTIPGRSHHDISPISTIKLKTNKNREPPLEEPEAHHSFLPFLLFSFDLGLPLSIEAALAASLYLYFPHR